jgi:hypothetical protein
VHVGAKVIVNRFALLKLLALRIIGSFSWGPLVLLSLILHPSRSVYSTVIRAVLGLPLPFIQFGLLGITSLTILSIISIRPVRRWSYRMFLIIHFQLVL